MDNYIVINGKKAELTEEQLEKLGIKVEKKDPFERVVVCDDYYYIECDGKCYAATERDDACDNDWFAVANYCTDKSLMEQRALHETLNRLLWRYSMQHGGGEIDWGSRNQKKWSLHYDHCNECFDVWFLRSDQEQATTYFATEETAKAAIDEIVKPFMAAHPEFKW